MEKTYESKNAQNVLEAVERRIIELETQRKSGWFGTKFYIREVSDELSIFDWWNDRLSLSQLKAMRTFLREAIKLGYTGYACFKVGAAYCASGMWAHKDESTVGYSPKGDCIYRSFYSKDNYWDVKVDGVFIANDVTGRYDGIKTARQLEAALKSY